MKRTFSLGALMVLGLSVLLLGCSKEDNPVQAEQFGEISGTVTFVGSWPQVGEVQVSIWANWPPMGPPAAASVAFQPGQNVQTYKIDGLSKGTYPVVTVGWRDPNNPAGAKVLGVYWANKDSVGVADDGITLKVQPIAIEISDDKLVWNNIDIKANLDIVK